MLAIALAGVLAAVDLAVAGGRARDLDDARSAIAAGQGVRALGELRSIGGAPSADVLVAQAQAHLAVGAGRSAAGDLRRAVAEAPERWELRRDLAVVLLRNGDRAAARASMAQALARNPRLVLPPGFTRPRG